MTYVYILCDHQGYGAENVVATLDRAQVPDLVDIGWPMDRDASPEEVSLYKVWVSELKVNLAKALEKSDEKLASRGGNPMMEAWGGMELHVVQLVE